jgi:hypothetical protein
LDYRLRWGGVGVAQLARLTQGKINDASEKEKN